MFCISKTGKRPIHMPPQAAFQGFSTFFNITARFSSLQPLWNFAAAFTVKFLKIDIN